MAVQIISEDGPHHHNLNRLFDKDQLKESLEENKPLTAAKFTSLLCGGPPSSLPSLAVMAVPYHVTLQTMLAEKLVQKIVGMCEETVPAERARKQFEVVQSTMRHLVSQGFVNQKEFEDLQHDMVLAKVKYDVHSS